MRKYLYLGAIFAGSMALFIIGWIIVYNIQNHFGFNNQATPKYGFTSGPGPMDLTALGMATIITGIWHGLNCHDDNCFRIGRHKVNGTPYCNNHHENARHHRSVEELLEEQNALLRRILEEDA